MFVPPPALLVFFLSGPRRREKDISPSAFGSLREKQAVCAVVSGLVTAIGT